MAPRKQAKQAVNSVATAEANGDATPPKKRKVAAQAAAITKPSLEEPKRTKATGARRAKTEKQEISENEVVTAAIEDVSLSKKPRGGKVKNVAAPKAVATEIEGKTSKKRARTEKAATNDGANERVTEQVTEKRMARAKASAKKAGTKEQTRTKAPTAKKQKNAAAIENNGADSVENVVKDGAEDAENKESATYIPAKRTRARAFVNALPVTQPAAKASKKRKNGEETKAAITGVGDAEVLLEEEEKKETVAEKKPRGGKSKKTGAQTGNGETEIKPKGRSKKNTAKAKMTKLPLEKTEAEEQSDHNTTAEDISKTKNAKNTKKENMKKTAPKRKRNVTLEKISGTEDMAIPEADTEENGGAENKAQIKQKKKNTGKMNTAMKEKTRVKSQQKKGQTTIVLPIDEKEATEDAIIENDNNEKMNAIIEISNENNTNTSTVPPTSNISEEEEEKNKIKHSESVESVTLIKNELSYDKPDALIEKNEN